MGYGIGRLAVLDQELMPHGIWIQIIPRKRIALGRIRIPISSQTFTFMRLLSSGGRGGLVVWTGLTLFPTELDR